MLYISTVFSHCFFIAHKDMMNDNEKKRINQIFLVSLAAKIFDEILMIG